MTPTSDFGERSYRYSKGKLTLMVLASIAFVAVGVFIISAQRGLYADLAGIVSICFFGAFGVSLLPEFRRGDAVITLTPQGLHDRRFGPDPIPWSEIKKLTVTESPGQVAVQLSVPSPERFVRRSTGMQAWLSRYNPSFGVEPLTLALNPLNEKGTTIAAEINRYWEAARATP